MNTTKQPISAVSAILVEHGKVLLIKRGNEPSKGLWSLPGGKQEFGECLEEAIIREIFEETNLKIATPKVLTHREAIKRNAEGEPISHYLLTVFSVDEFTGNAKAGDDAQDCQWADRSTLLTLAMTDGTCDLILKLIGHRLT